MNLVGFGYLRLDTPSTTQRRNWVLEHHRNISSNRFVGRLTQTAEFSTLKLDTPFLWPYQTHDRSAQGGFS